MIRIFLLFSCVWLITAERVRFEMPDEVFKIPGPNGEWMMMSRAEITDKIHDSASINNVIDTKFHLFTSRSSRQTFTLENIGDIRYSTFNKNNPTRVTIHGFLGDLTSGVNKAVIAATFDGLRGTAEGCNIIAVDWSQDSGSHAVEYYSVRNRVNDVATLVAEVLDRLVSYGLVDLRNVTLIGHSLGAHIAGMAGKHAKSGKIDTIVGLDPAGPLFFRMFPNNRLDATDATYVEVIHTSGDDFGYWYQLGDADFYANGGVKYQPGCHTEMVPFVSECSHSRVADLYAESLTSTKGFWATKCDSLSSVRVSGCDAVGGDEPLMKVGGFNPKGNNAHGVYWFKTGDKSPFTEWQSASLFQISHTLTCSCHDRLSQLLEQSNTKLDELSRQVDRLQRSIDRF